MPTANGKPSVSDLIEAERALGRRLSELDSLVPNISSVDRWYTPANEEHKETILQFDPQHVDVLRLKIQRQLLGLRQTRQASNATTEVSYDTNSVNEILTESVQRPPEK